MYECILVILTELRSGGGAFLVIQCFCKKWEKTNNNTYKIVVVVIIIIIGLGIVQKCLISISIPIPIL